MASSRVPPPSSNKSLLVSICFTLLLLAFSGRTVSADLFSPLALGYYRNRCSQNPEVIVREVVKSFTDQDPTLAAGLLRMHFHDSFVRGTEASVLLKSPNNDAERNSLPNLSLRGFEVIDEAKRRVENACPGVVSCADILALAARDSVVATGGLWWPVPTGRRDGVESHASETTDLPPPFGKFPQLLAMFQKKNLTKLDLVVLSGAHTLGRGHCGAFSSRIYNSSGAPATDPALDSDYANQLRSLCRPNDRNSSVEMDPESSLKFDNDYYSTVKSHKGLFTSDAALLDDEEAAKMVDEAERFDLLFKGRFAQSMVKMGHIGVLTGRPGEPASQIRKQCAFVNP